MKIIKKLVDLIDDELDASERYIDCANKYKTEFPALSRVFFTLSDNEMQHYVILHGEVVKIIEKYRTEKGEPPAEMLAIYDYWHKKYIKWASDIKRLQDMYSQN